MKRTKTMIKMKMTTLRIVCGQGKNSYEMKMENHTRKYTRNI